MGFFSLWARARIENTNLHALAQGEENETSCAARFAGIARRPNEWLRLPQSRNTRGTTIPRLYNGP